MSGRVYRLSITGDRKHPEIDYSANSSVDWLSLGQMLDGERPLNPSAVAAMNIVVPTQQAFDVLRMDYRFIVSARARECLESARVEGVDFIPTRVNERQFFHLVVRRNIDCLDRTRSDVEYFPGDPTRIMAFRRCVLRKELIPDPAIFCLPESRTRFFVTESIERAVVSAGLKGFRFVECEAEAF